MIFNITEYEMFLNMISDSTLQLTSETIHSQLRFSIKEYPQ